MDETKVYKAVVALMFRLLLLLLLLRFFYFDLIRYLLNGHHPPTDNRELVAPLNPFASGPVPVEQASLADRLLRPGERLIEAPDAPEGSFPMVEGVDGRLFQLTPGGGRHPVDNIDLPSRLSNSEFEGRLFKWDAGGKLTPDVRRRFVP